MENWILWLGLIGKECTYLRLEVVKNAERVCDSINVHRRSDLLRDCTKCFILLGSGQTSEWMMRVMSCLKILKWGKRPPHNILYVDGQSNLANLPPFSCKLLGD